MPTSTTVGSLKATSLIKNLYGRIGRRRRRSGTLERIRKATQRTVVNVARHSSARTLFVNDNEGNDELYGFGYTGFFVSVSLRQLTSFSPLSPEAKAL